MVRLTFKQYIQEQNELRDPTSGETNLVAADVAFGGAETGNSFILRKAKSGAVLTPEEEERLAAQQREIGSFGAKSVGALDTQTGGYSRIQNRLNQATPLELRAMKSGGSEAVAKDLGSRISAAERSSIPKSFYHPSRALVGQFGL